MISILDSGLKVPGSIPCGSSPGYLYPTSTVTLCGKVTVQVCRPSEGTLSRRSLVHSIEMNKLFQQINISNVIKFDKNDL